MYERVTPAALQALALEYDELGIKVNLIRTSRGTPAELEHLDSSGKWNTIFADLELVAEADDADRYRAVVDLEAEAAWRSQ